MSLPDFFIIQGVSLRSEDNTLFSDSQNLKRLVRSRTGQRWRVTMDLKLKPEDSLAGFAWLVRRKAQAFSLSIPGWTGNGPSTATISTGNTAGAGSIQVSSAAGISAGQFFTAPGSSKLYQVESISGSTLLIVPDLLNSVSGGGTLNFAGAEMTVFIASDIPEMGSESLLSPSVITVEFVEAIP